MTTSANVIEYRIDKIGDDQNGFISAGHHRQSLLCKEHWEDLLIFNPANEYIITPYGYDENEEYWEGIPQNLEKFLDKKLKRKFLD